MSHTSRSSVWVPTQTCGRSVLPNRALFYTRPMASEHPPGSGPIFDVKLLVEGTWKRFGDLTKHDLTWLANEHEQGRKVPGDDEFAHELRKLTDV